MNYLIHRFSLDVNETSAQISLACKKNDTAIRLCITLTDSGKPYKIADGCVAVFTATKADGNGLYNYCMIKNNTIIYDFTEQTVSCAGKVNVEIRLSNGEIVLTSPEFILIVDETVMDESELVSSPEATALIQLVGEANEAVENTKTAVDSANSAVEAANAAANSANGAAARANSFATSANAAALLAENAANSANAAAEAANAAAENVPITSKEKLGLGSVDNTSDMDKPASIPQQEMFCKKNPDYTATPKTLADVISSAEIGAVIQLTAGGYDLLTLSGQNAYPENLTIEGEEGAVVAGISITSGVQYTEPNVSGDTSNLVLPQGLTIKNVTFSDNFCLRNGGIDNLSIIGCTFTHGAIEINPNSLQDKYGEDGLSSTGYTRPNHLSSGMENLLIKDCVFKDATAKDDDPIINGQEYNPTAIYVNGVHNVTVQGNVVGAVRQDLANKGLIADFNGIQITGDKRCEYSTGKIAVYNNWIYNTGSRSIRISYLKDAEFWFINNNVNNANLIETENEESVKVSDCINTNCHWLQSNGQGANYYNGESITVDNGGIAVVSVSPATDVFIAIFGETTNAEMNAAIDAGKEVLCLHEGIYHQLSGRIFADNMWRHYFAYDTAGNVKRIIHCLNNGWWNDALYFARTTGATMTGTLKAAADTEPTVAKVRNTALVSTETTPTQNGDICWQYE